MNPPKPTMTSDAVIWPLRIACMASATVVVATSSKSVPTVGLRHSRRALAGDGSPTSELTGRDFETYFAQEVK